MGLLTAIGIVKIDPQKQIYVDVNRFKEIEKYSENLLNDLSEALKDLHENKIQESESNLFKAEQLDINLLRSLKGSKYYERLKVVLVLIHKAIRDLRSKNYRHTEELEKTANNILEFLVKEEQKDLKYEEGMLNTLIGFYNTETIYEHELSDFFKSYSGFFLAKPNKILAKRIEEDLRGKIFKPKNYEGDIKKVALRLISEPSTKSSPDEQKQMYYESDRLAKLYGKNIEDVKRDLSKTMHDYKKEVGRRGL